MALSNQYLHTLTTNATRLGTRISETISEQARELSGGNSSSMSSALDTTDDRAKLAGIKKQLEPGSNEREKLDALKRLVALTSKSHPPTFTLPFFPSVVKLVASPSLEIRKLVYIYLLHHSPYDPDLALLSINTFQRDLSSDPNPLIRAMALRVLSGMRVPMVVNVVVMGIKKCASDTSPYVRKVAALAIPKVYELDPSQLPALLPILTQTLLSPSSFSPLSIGATVYSFNVICLKPLSQSHGSRGYISIEEQTAYTNQTIEYLKLIHPQFRKLCRILVDADEWGQVEVMRLLLRYARVMLPKPIRAEEGYDLDKDLKLLLTSVEPTFMSRNPSVVLAAAKVYYYIAPSTDPTGYWRKFISPVLRLLAVSQEVERVVIRYLVVLTSRQKAISTLLAPHYTSFLLRLASDSVPLQKDKIRLLLNLLNADDDELVENIWLGILREFIACVENVGDDEVIKEAVGGVGELARRVGFGVTSKGPGAAGTVREDVIKMCVTALMDMIGSPYDIVVSSSVQVLQQLVQLQLSFSTSELYYLPQQQTPLTIIARLAKQFDDIKHADARACVVWLVGQYAPTAASPANTNTTTTTSKATVIDGIADWAPDLLRKCAKTFANEAPIVKMQIVTLAGKLIVLAPPPPATSSPAPGTGTEDPPPDAAPPDVDEKVRKLALLVKYVVFGLARYDSHWDVRDRARLVWGLVKGLVDKFLGNGDGANEMGGVVLRREQVRVVLFEGKAGGGFVDDERAREGGRGALGALSAFGIGPTSSSSSVAAKNYQEYDELEDDDVEKGAGGDGGLVLDSFDEDVPEWMERGVESKLRDSAEDSAAARKPVITSMGSSNFNNKAGPSGSGIGGKAASAGPVVLVPTNLAGSSEPEASEGKKKWKDLEAFYAEEEHQEESEEEEEEDSEEGEEDDDDDDDDDEEEGEEEESAESDGPKAANASGGDEDAEDSSEDDADERRHLTARS